MSIETYSDKAGVSNEEAESVIFKPEDNKLFGPEFTHGFFARGRGGEQSDIIRLIEPNTNESNRANESERILRELVPAASDVSDEIREEVK